eukprot:g28695.t1
MTLLINWWTHEPHGLCPSPGAGEAAAACLAELTATLTVPLLDRGSAKQGFEEHLEDGSPQRVPRDLLPAIKDGLLSVSYLERPPEDWWS